MTYSNSWTRSMFFNFVYCNKTYKGTAYYYPDGEWVIAGEAHYSHTEQERIRERIKAYDEVHSNQRAPGNGPQDQVALRPGGEAVPGSSSDPGLDVPKDKGR